MKPLWHLADLIDFEYLLSQDDILMEKDGPDVFKHRDRDIYLEKIAPAAEGQGGLTPPLLLHRWLKVRQQQEAEQAEGSVLPGRAWNEMYRIAWWGLLLLGLATGAGLAFSFLVYSGAEPVNVTLYLVLFVGLQIVSIAVLGAAFYYRQLRRLDLRSSMLYGLLSGLMLRAMLRLNRYAGTRMTASQRLQISAAHGLMRQKIQTHASCLLWPVFTLFQVLAIGLNLGVLGATLLKVISADIAFGWQSTLQVSAHLVFSLVKAIALPWSWFVSEHIAYPSLLHIEGSQMILKEGIYHLATADLVSWWPFLCLAVLFYGLLPRIVLLSVGLASLRRSMARLQFQGISCGQLMQRMTTPRVSSQAPMPNHSPGPLVQGPAQVEESVETPIVAPDDQALLYTAVALIPDELYGQCPLNVLQPLMQKRLGVSVLETLCTGESYRDEQLLLGQLAERKGAGKIKNIVILQEAWQPPILEFLEFVMQVRRSLGVDVLIVVALVGKPGSDTIFTPTKKEDMTIWQQKIRAMGEPDIQVLEVVAA